MIGKPKGGTTFLRGAKDIISRIAGRMFAQLGVRMKTAETHDIQYTVTARKRQYDGTMGACRPRTIRILD